MPKVDAVRTRVPTPKRSQELGIGASVPLHAVQLGELAQHCRLYHRYGNAPATGTASLAPAATANPRIWASICRAFGSSWRPGKLGEGQRNGGRRRGDQRAHQGLATVVGRFEAVARLREVDGNEAQTRPCPAAS